MNTAESGVKLALQPESDIELTALSRVREIYRRTTQYRLPAPYWDNPANYEEVDKEGLDVLVFIDGMNCGTDSTQGEGTAAAWIDDGTGCQKITPNCIICNSTRGQI